MPDTPDAPQRVGGRYQLGDVLGRGGMADVRRARDAVLGREVAIKLLRTTDTVDRSRFDSEARLLALLSHENVVTVLDAGVEDGSDGVAWLALELVEGDTLADRFSRGPLDPTVVADVGAQVASALRHAHGHGIVHRDVKPSNVLIDASGRARLTDFGIARLVDDESALTMTGHAVGTAAYIAPEQVAGETVTTASDVYALGLLLLEGLTGRREYPGPPVEAALARLQRSPLVPVSLPSGWPALIATMTARRPEERPSADAVVQRLRTLARPQPGAAPAPLVTEALPLATLTLPTMSPPPPPPPAAPRERRRRRGAWLLAAAAAIVFLLAGSALVLGGSGDGDAPVDSDAPATTSDSPAPTSTPDPAPAVRTTSSAPTTAPTTPPATQATPATPAAPAGNGNGKDPKKDKGKSKGGAGGKGKGKGKP